MLFKFNVQMLSDVMFRCNVQMSGGVREERGRAWAAPPKEVAGRAARAAVLRQLRISQVPIQLAPVRDVPPALLPLHDERCASATRRTTTAKNTFFETALRSGYILFLHLEIWM